MLQFILGPAASGKTFVTHEMIKNEIDEGNDNLILLVPEQNTFETERAMLSKFGGGFMSMVEVLSFTRLCEKAGRLYGGIAGFNIDDSGRNIIMGKVLKKLSPHLTVFKKYISSTTFIRRMVGVIKELKTAGVSSDLLISVCEKDINKNLADKVSEIAMIYAAYNDELKGIYIDPLEELETFYQKAIDNRFFDGMTIYIDAFKGFTGLQLKILKLMITSAKKVVISFCSNRADFTDKSDVFSNVVMSAGTLKQYAEEHGITVAEPIMLNNSFYVSKELYSLEKVLAGENISEFCGNSQNIKISTFESPVKEIENVFKTIHRLVRTENYRFKDFVIIARDISKYERRIALASKKYNTPCFLDSRKIVGVSPIARFVLAMLKAAQNLNSESIFSFLKTDLFDISAEDLNALEEYVYIWSINGEDWLNEWDMNPLGFTSVKDYEADSISKSLEHLNDIRKKVIIPILSLKKSFGGDAKDFSKAIYDTLMVLKIDKTVKSLCDELLSVNNSEDADFIMQSWDAVMQILDNMVRCFSGENISVEEYINMLELSFSGFTIGRIPRMLDEVSCGSADRIRPARPKVVFVIGMNMGEFPSIAEDNGILLRNDRITLSKNGIDISDRFRKYVIDENFLVYSACACASEKVFISRHSLGFDGARYEESSIFSKLKKTFKNSVCTYEDDLPETFEEGFSKYAEIKNDASVLSNTLREVFENNPDYKKRIIALNNNALRIERRVDSDIVKKLFGNTLHLSASKVEVYNKCPLSYFCKYVLGIKKLQKAELDSMQRGTVVHYVLEKVIGDAGANFVNLTENTIDELVDKTMEDYLKSVGGRDVLKTLEFEFAYREMAKTLKILLKYMVLQFKNSDFVPDAFELNINSKDGSVPSLVLEFNKGEKLSLSGQIDRVDVLKLEDGRELVRVIDYKTGSKEFHLSDVLYGQNLQMLIYLYILCKVEGSPYAGMEPAGILYMPSKRGTATQSSSNSLAMNGMILNDSDVITAMDKSGEGKFVFKPPKSERLGNPTITGEDFSVVFDFLENKLKETAKHIKGGIFDLTPCDGRTDSACKYCDFKTVCAATEDLEHSYVEGAYPTEIINKMKEAKGYGMD